jgi:hypothetical protein
MSMNKRRRVATATAAGLVIAAGGLLATAPARAATPDAVARANWREAITKLTLPAAGCFRADYPDVAWTQVACREAPKTPYIPRHATLGGVGNTVGDGADYAAAVTKLITHGVGSFTSVTGVTSIKDQGQANTYSLQLNSNFFTTTICNGAVNPASCLGWQQFVYSNSGVAFMQYWLINYGSKCPSGGWMAYSGDCYRNSAAVGVPIQSIAQFPALTVTGTASATGNDKMVLTTSTSAYTTGGKDTVVHLADGWTQSEYNVIGDGGGSQSVFNKGSAITVHIALVDGIRTAPTCATNAGTTGETNNLNLGACTTAAGAQPSISFVESN